MGALKGRPYKPENDSIQLSDWTDEMKVQFQGFHSESLVSSGTSVGLSKSSA